MDTNDRPSPHDPQLAPLTEHLASTAATLDVGHPAVDAVIARALHRRRQTRRAVGVASVVAIAGLTVTSITWLSRPAQQRITGASPGSAQSDDSAVSPPNDPAPSDPTPTDAEPADPAPSDPAPGTGDVSLIVPSNLVWNIIEPDSAEAIATADYGDGRRVVGDGPFLALSTSPGTRDDYEPMLWRSDDGISWQQVATPPDVVGRTIAAGGGRFFTLGTTPASADAGRISDAGVASSDDGGLTWTTNVLPIDTSAFDGHQGVTSVGVMTQSIAAGPEGVVVAAAVYPNVDFDSILPDDAATNGFNVTREGLQVYAATSCSSPSTATTAVVAVNAPASTVVGGAGESDDAGDAPCTSGPPIDRTIAWSDLGVGQSVIDAMLSSGLQLFASGDGVTFERVLMPTVDGETVSSVKLAHLDDGFVMTVGTNEGGPGNGTVFESPDGGRSWSYDGVAPLVWPMSFDGDGDRLVVVGSTPDGNLSQNAVAVRTGDTWTVTVLDDLLTPDDGVITTMAAFNPVVASSGITLSAALIVDPVAEIGGAEMARDGVVLRAEDTSGRFQVLDETTRDEIGTMTYWSDTTGPVTLSQVDGSIDVLADDGSVRAHFTQEDLSDLTYGPGIPQIPVETLVLHSSDGVHWSRESLSDIAGREVVSTAGIRVSGSQIVIAANTGERNPDASPRQVLLIGTPAG